MLNIEDTTLLRNIEYDFVSEIGKTMKFSNEDGEVYNVVILGVGVAEFPDRDLTDSIAVADLSDGGLYDVGIGYIKDFEISDEHYDPIGVIGKRATPVKGFGLHNLEKGFYYEIVAVAEARCGTQIVSVLDTLGGGTQTLPLSDLEIKL